VTAAATPASPIPSGSGATVTITGAASGCPNPRYEFWMRAAGSTSWKVVQGWSTNATYRWNTAGAPSGVHYFGVWARDAASTAAYDSFASLPFTLTASCPSVTASFSPPSPIPHGSGATVTITAAASGCPNPLYEFWMRPAGSTTWHLLQAYSTTPTYIWNTKGAPAGTEYFGVWVRDASSRATYDSLLSAPYTLS
jgi:hypothetical protein